MQKYAFVDRDGTILWEPARDMNGVAASLQSVDEARFVDGALDGLEHLARLGYHFVLATNQDDLGTPHNPRQTFDKVQDFMFSELAKRGVEFDFVMVCPHSFRAGCDCRKPKIGGLIQFLNQHTGQIDFEQSLMFGDRDTDRRFAANLGVQFVPVATNGTFVVPAGL